jgi:hypothetical protein
MGLKASGGKLGQDWEQNNFGQDGKMGHGKIVFVWGGVFEQMVEIFGDRVFG